MKEKKEQNAKEVKTKEINAKKVSAVEDTKDSQINSKKEVAIRYLIFLIGLFVNSFGVSFITKSNLGTSPISSIPYTLSLGFSPSLGTFTIYMSVALILFQLVLLRKKFPKEYILQIPVSILFGWFIDLTMQLLWFMKPSIYIVKIIYLLVGCFILGFGVYLEMLANVVMLPGESFVRAVSETFHTDFGKTKVVFDSSTTVIAVCLGFLFLHRLAGVREGTVIAAILVGSTARFLKRKLLFAEERIFASVAKEHAVFADDARAEQKVKDNTGNVIITISREFGSNGRNIAFALAKSLNLNYYDKKIIELAAKESDFSEQFVEVQEEKMTNSFLYDLFSQYSVTSDDKTDLDKLYEVEAKIIREVAEQGNCVIVGRCADYILRKRTNCYHIFLHASEEYKIQTVMKRESMDYDQAKKYEKMINRKRFMHYKYYTGRIWGRAKNYDLTIDVTKHSIEEIVAMITFFISLKENQINKEKSA